MTLGISFFFAVYSLSFAPMGIDIGKTHRIFCISLCLCASVFHFFSDRAANANSPWTFGFGNEADRPDSMIRVLVLPPYDRIANVGGSPDTRSILEETLSGKNRLSVIPFPFKKLMGVRYQMIFDKKYCKEILEKVDCDVVVMTQIITDNELRPGIWPWAYKVRVYNARSEKQIESISGNDLKAEDFRKDIESKVDKLISDIAKSY
jgi:hypothetical protein